MEYALVSSKSIIPTNGFTSWNDVTSAIETAGGVTGNVRAGNQRIEIVTGVLDEIVRKGTQNERDYVLLAVHMTEEVGNEYQGKDAIIDVTIVATQKNAESDAFDNQYDKDAQGEAPAFNTFKAVYDTNGDANTLTFH